MRNENTNAEHASVKNSDQSNECAWWENLSIHEYYLAASYCTSTEWETIGL